LRSGLGYHGPVESRSANIEQTSKKKGAPVYLLGGGSTALSFVEARLSKGLRVQSKGQTKLIRELKDMPNHTVLRLVREVRDDNW
jgi:hypothetical protein